MASTIKYRYTNNTYELAAKNLIRMAVFTEQKRTPLSRQDIIKKCNLPARSFNAVLGMANALLEKDFGMTLTQLSVRDRRKGVLNAESLNTEEKKSNQWILQ